MSDDLDTEPPTVTETEVPQAPRLPAELVEHESAEPPGYDPNRWDHYSLRTLVAAVKSFGPAAQKALVQSAVDEAKAAFANLVNDELRGMRSELSKVTGRVDTLEELEQGDKVRLAELENAVAKLKADLARVTTDLAALQEKAHHHGAAPQQAPAQPPAG